MQLTDVIEWKNPKEYPPPDNLVLAVTWKGVQLGWISYEEYDKNYYLFNEEGNIYSEGIILWWAELPKTPEELEKEEDAYFIQCEDNSK